VNCSPKSKVLGILGGMGPLASAEFLKTIYEFNLCEVEQESPACILYSDPTFPDRTDAIICGSDDLLVGRLARALEALYQLGASKVVIPCVTIHHFLPMISTRLRKRLISLIDLIIEEISTAKRPALMLCSNGTYKARLFQRHHGWHLVDRYIAFPNEEDQGVVHGLIYQLKRNHIPDVPIPWIDALVQKYRVECLVAGCTEIHLLTKRLTDRGLEGRNYGIVDPLLTLARDFKRFVDE